MAKIYKEKLLVNFCLHQIHRDVHTLWYYNRDVFLIVKKLELKNMKQLSVGNIDDMESMLNCKHFESYINIYAYIQQNLNNNQEYFPVKYFK